MRTAFAHWDGRIAPVFDTSRLVRLVDVENEQVVAQVDKVLKKEMLFRRADGLLKMGVNTLVCGAISRQLEVLIWGHGIEVIPFVAGDLDSVVKAFISGTVVSDSFKMPGCTSHCGTRKGLDKKE